MTPDILVAIAGAGLSLVLAFVPRVNAWYEALAVDVKRQVMGGAVIAAAVLVGLGSCVSLIGSILPPEWLVPCTQTDIGALVRLALTALGANQTVYWAAVKPTQSFFAARAK